MFQGPLCPNLSQKVKKEVSQMVNRNLSHVILLGGLSVNLNHLKKSFAPTVKVSLVLSMRGEVLERVFVVQVTF